VRKPIGAGVVLVAILLASGQPAHAGDQRLDSAREHSQQGDAYYKLEKYANAITEYEQAYLAKADPSFLYNIAQCHRLNGNGAEAIKFYRRYLKDAPNAPNRAVAEKHIRDLQETTGDGMQPPSPPVAPIPSPPPATTPAPVTPLPSSSTTPPPALSAPSPTSTPVSTTPVVENGAPTDQSESKPIYSRWWFWAGIGAVVVGGIILIAVAKRDPSCPGDFTCHN
jgi:tetratricopeptide (TPR) repeat protein